MPTAPIAVMFPKGRTLYYEGPDPETFATEVWLATSGQLDPSNSPGWAPAAGWAFHCPPEHLHRVYYGPRWTVGT